MSGQTVSFPRLVLNTHLCGQAFFCCKLGELTGFGELVSERLLKVNMFAPLHRIHGSGVVSMIRSGDGNRIDLVVEFGQHFSVVLKGGGTFKLFRPVINFTVGVIDITKSDHFDIVMLGEVSGIHATLTSGTDMGSADFAIGGLGP